MRKADEERCKRGGSMGSSATKGAGTPPKADENLMPSLYIYVHWLPDDWAKAKPARSKKEPQPLIIPKNATDEQRLKLERLMRNPDKLAAITERLKECSPRSAPEVVRDVMGSSARAGSGEFHIYQHPTAA
ncbi:PRKR-interacting protein 1 homolog [Xenopus laevis]|uniref:PRKR-interacting protein 1 homolog n=1 Tax=Xenopus laevis TaxID=8355 RepID=A0A8J1MHT9_XENLA|nr:PRKR-interacting protein 1 homolog [Xenopus laevis]